MFSFSIHWLNTVQSSQSTCCSLMYCLRLWECCHPPACWSLARSHRRFQQEPRWHQRQTILWQGVWHKPATDPLGRTQVTSQHLWAGLRGAAHPAAEEGGKRKGQQIYRQTWYCHSNHHYYSKKTLIIQFYNIHTIRTQTLGQIQLSSKKSVDGSRGRRQNVASKHDKEQK